MPRNVMSKLVMLVAMAAPMLIGTGGMWGCSRDYSQATPDDVLQSARAMVENGDVHRLPDLIYAESKEMRQLLTQLGPVLRSLQELAGELYRAFPDEITQIKTEAQQAAERGEASGFLGRMMGGAMGGGMGGPQRGPAQGRNRRAGASTAPTTSPAAAGDMRRSFDAAMKELFADPYGWLERSEGRLTTQYISDDLSALLWDGKPVFGVGLLMKEERGKWYIMLPTALPGLGQLAPNSDEMWQIAGSLMAALDNAIKDTRREVRAGEHRSMEDLARSVGEKAAIPAVAIMFAYQRAAQVERREQREREQQARESQRSPAGS